MILYLIGGRGFSKNNVGRKMYEVINCFNNVVETEVIFGGDIPIVQQVTSSTSKSEYHAKWYRKNRIMLFFSESFAEIKSLRHNYQIYKFIKNHSKDYRLVWERSSGLHWAGILYANRNGIPSVLEWKDHLIKDYPSLFKPLSIIIERWKVKKADFIAVESKVLKDNLVNQGVPANKIFVTYNAVNPSVFHKDTIAKAEVRKELGITESDILVGYVGSYAFYHDSIRMVKASKVLRDKGVDNIKWLLIGDGKDKAVCEQYAREQGLIDKNVLMLPFQPKEKIPRYLSAMDVTILPGSTDIICPIKVMEYMAASSVVLVPDYECNREIIDGTNGLLFKPGSEESIAEVLVDLSKDNKKCEQLGNNARQTVIQKLTWDKTYGAVLKQILKTVQ